MKYLDKALYSLILRSLRTHTFILTAKVKILVSLTRSFSAEKRMRYIYHMIGYESIWVSVPKEKIASLPFPVFMVLNDGFWGMSLIEKNTEENYTSYDIENPEKSRSIDLDFLPEENLFFIFEKNSSPLLAEDTKSSRIPFSENFGFAVLMLGGGLATFLLTKSIYLLLTMEIALLGTFLFIALIKHHFAGEDNIIFKVCNAGSSNSCDKVFNYRFSKFRILDIKLLGLIYFVAVLLIYIGIVLDVLEGSLGNLVPVVVIGLAGVVFSLITQIFVIKTFCKLCLFSSLLIVANTALILPTVFDQPILVFDILQSLFFIGMATVFSFTYYRALENKSIQNNLESSLVYLKSEYDVFRSVVSLNHTLQPSKKFGAAHFSFGSDQPEAHIEMIISLRCPHCYQALGKMLNVLEKSTKYDLEIWFSQKGTPDLKEILFLNTLLENKDTYDMYSFYENLNKWYHSENTVPIRSQDSHNRLISGVQVTPLIIIDEHVVPSFYNYEEINYLLST